MTNIAVYLPTLKTEITYFELISTLVDFRNQGKDKTFKDALPYLKNWHNKIFLLFCFLN